MLNEARFDISWGSIFLRYRVFMHSMRAASSVHFTMLLLSAIDRTGDYLS